MRLSVKKTKNKTFYYAIESKREGKKVTSFIVRKFGEHAELLAEGIEDPEDWCRKEIGAMNRDAREQIVTLTDTYDCRPWEGPAVDIVSRPTYRNVGFRYPMEIIERLDLRGFLETIKKKARYDAYPICVNLVVDRMINPRSKRGTFLNKDLYLADFDYGQHDMYRFLELLGANSEKMQEHLFGKTKEIIGLDTEVFYYDCTNFYFETEKEDENECDDKGDIVQWGMRRYGVCKEHRPNPIVQMGLFTDRNGIPLSYCLEHGSNNEQNTILPMERQMVDRYKQSEFIYCADAGLGTLKSRVFNSLPGRGYVVTQSLKELEDAELKLVFKDENWQVFGNGDSDPSKDMKISIEAFRTAWEKKLKKEEMTAEEESLASHDMIYKIFPLQRKVTKKLLTELGFKVAKGMTLTENLCVTFSMKYYLYEKEILDGQIARAQKKVDEGKLKPTNPNDVRRLVSANAVTKTGECCDVVVLDLDMERIARERSFHGFYAIASNLDRGIYELLRITCQRWIIEHSFRLLKTDFDTRPVYSWTPEGIRGHFAICYIALLVYRILERQLFLGNPEQNSFSSRQILDTLRNLNVDRMENGRLYKALYTKSVILQELEKIYPLRLNAKYFRVEKIEGSKK